MNITEILQMDITGRLQMDIDTTNNVIFNVGDNDVIRLAKSGQSGQSGQSSVTSRNDASDAALRIAHDQAIEDVLAINLEDIDLQAITQARHDLRSGQLDTAQNVRHAAQNILRFGV